MRRMNNFGEFLREKRLSLGKGLRAFCLENNLDSLNYSKIERGRLKPPSGEKLKGYADFLQIEKGSNEWFNFFDLAMIARKCTPENKEFVLDFPLLFRNTETGDHYTKDELLRLIEDIKRSEN